MRHDHLKRELDLLLFLTQNREMKVEEICEKLDISRRNFYYFISFFQQSGFIVKRTKSGFSISRDSEFFRRLFDLVQFSDSEVLLLRQLLENNGCQTQRMKALYDRLDNFFDFKAIDDPKLQKASDRIRRVINDAIRRERKIRITGYSSPHSHTVSDRTVEPFLFMNNGKDVRCYETEAEKNKTFRISRMQSVEVLDEPWEHADEHRAAYADIFSFTGEKTMRVTMLMGQLSHNVMLEEYPQSATCFVPAADGRWLFQCDVCSYLGVGRFVLGLYDDIEITGDDGFKAYIAQKITQWYGRLTE